MLSVSEAYRELVKSNIRPKVEPVITVSGEDESGNSVSLTWNAKQIQKMNFNRGIDPVGREISYMELTWTEIYTGKLNAENYPEKYENITKYMAVDLSFIQNIGYVWEKKFAQEIIKMPRMFLEAKPAIDGQTITWTAKDLLFFLERTQIKMFEENVPYRNVLRWFLIEERANTKNNKVLLNAIQKTQAQLLKTFYIRTENDEIITTETDESIEIEGESNDDLIGKKIVLENSTKQLLTGIANIKNYHWQFDTSVAKLVKFSTLLNKTEPVYTFSSRIMYAYPKLTSLPTISGYSFKQHYFELDEENKYTLSPCETLYWKNITYYNYVFKGVGQFSLLEDVPIIANSAVSNVNTLKVTPVNFKETEYFTNQNQSGEVFNEDNACNPYNLNDPDIIDRISYLNEYFKQGCYSVELESLPNLALEPGDLTAVETNLFSDNERIVKNALIISIQLEYTGALKQKTILHTR